MEGKDLGFPLYNNEALDLNKNLQVISGHLLNQNGHLIDLSTRIPQAYTNLHAVGINEAGLIVGQADVQTDLNQFQQHGVLLLPVELKQLNYPTSTDTTDMGPTQSKVIGADQIAYITGTPEMPRLEASLGAALLSGMTVECRMEVKTERTERGTKDDLYIPQTDETSVVTLPINQPWRIYEDFIAPADFFGGTCTVFFRIKGSGGNYLGDEQKFEFKIRGKNPKDADAKSYIEGSEGTYRFAWAMAQQESRQGNRVHNQFNSGGDGLAIWNCQTSGRPTVGALLSSTRR